jgi:glycosyltransferase involved in cell wall biosynthesis
MKILIFNWRDIKNPEGGGAEVFTHENAKRWVEKGNEVVVYTSAFKGCKKEENIDGVRIIRDSSGLSVYRGAKRFYRKYFYKQRFDVVVDEINTRPFFTPDFINHGEKIVALIHQLAREFWFYETFFPINLIGYYFLEKRWLRRYIDVPTVAVSESTKKDLTDLGFKEVYKVSEGLTFQPMNKPPEKEEKPVLIYLGRLKRAKRPMHLIEAFKIVKKEIPEAWLWVVGDGYLRNRLERTAGKGVEFLGYVSEKEKIDLLSRAWVLVNPSVREGWGINILEANACATPCIAYDVPGLRDSIVDGKTGLLIKNEPDTKTLGRAVVELLKNDKLRKKLGENALKWSKNFSWDKSAEEFMKVLENILNG